MEWQKRLHDHEEEPPPKAWEAIREEISSLPSDLGRKLASMEENPPAEAWEQIRTALGVGEDARLKPDFKDIPGKGAVRSLPSRAFAYAASLAGIGLFLSLVYWYATDRRNEGTLLGGMRPPTQQNGAGNPGTPTLPETTGQPGVDEAAADSVSPILFTRVRKSSLPGMIELCDNRGNCVAVSSKMRDMAESVTPGFNASAARAVKSRKWNRTLRRWQKRLQDSQYLPTPGNLFDIGQLADLLSEKP
jgi:hypothetical protein